MLNDIRVNNVKHLNEMTEKVATAVLFQYRKILFLHYCFTCMIKKDKEQYE